MHITLMVAYLWSSIHPALVISHHILVRVCGVKCLQHFVALLAGNILVASTEQRIKVSCNYHCGSIYVMCILAIESFCIHNSLRCF